jgi:hypothetical protein
MHGKIAGSSLCWQRHDPPSICPRGDDLLVTRPTQTVCNKSRGFAPCGGPNGCSIPMKLDQRSNHGGGASSRHRCFETFTRKKGRKPCERSLAVFLDCPRLLHALIGARARVRNGLKWCKGSSNENGDRIMHGFQGSISISMD